MPETLTPNLTDLIIIAKALTCQQPKLTRMVHCLQDPHSCCCCCCYTCHCQNLVGSYQSWGGGRVLEIAPASNPGIKVDNHGDQNTQMPSICTVTKKNSKNTQFWYRTVITEKSNTRPPPPPLCPQHFFEFFEIPSTMTVLGI